MKMMKRTLFAAMVLTAQIASAASKEDADSAKAAAENLATVAFNSETLSDLTSQEYVSIRSQVLGLVGERYEWLSPTLQELFAEKYDEGEEWMVAGNVKMSDGAYKGSIGNSFFNYAEEHYTQAEMETDPTEKASLFGEAVSDYIKAGVRYDAATGEFLTADAAYGYAKDAMNICLGILENAEDPDMGGMGGI